MLSFRAMNSRFQIAGLSTEQGQRIRSWFRYVENRLSRFDSESELTLLNHSQGHLFLASSLLYEVARKAYQFFLETNQVFHPFLGKNIVDLGYDRSFEKLGKAGERQIEDIDVQDRSFIFFDPGMKALRLDSDVALDLGGIAKGWSVYQAQQWLQKDGVRAGLLDGGGDIAGWGNSGTWTIGVADPFRPLQDIVRLEMKHDFGIATSNTIKRSWLNHGGRRLHHLLDPTTGKSAQSDLVQVTMLAPDVLTAEIYAKVLLIMGSKRGMGWLAERKPELAFIAIDKHGKVLISDRVCHYGLLREGGCS